MSWSTKCKDCGCDIEVSEIDAGYAQLHRCDRCLVSYIDWVRARLREVLREDK